MGLAFSGKINDLSLRFVFYVSGVAMGGGDLKIPQAPPHLKGGPQMCVRNLFTLTVTVTLLSHVVMSKCRGA